MIGQNCHQADQLDFCGQPTCGSLSPAPFELLGGQISSSDEFVSCENEDGCVWRCWCCSTRCVTAAVAIVFSGLEAQNPQVVTSPFFFIDTKTGQISILDASQILKTSRKKRFRLELGRLDEQDWNLDNYYYFFFFGCNVANFYLCPSSPNIFK